MCVMCITPRFMELWATLFAGCGKAAFCFSMSCEPFTGYCRDRIACQLLHFVGQCIGDTVKRTIFIVSVDIPHMGNPVFLRCQCDHCIFSKTLRHNSFRFLMKPLHVPDLLLPVLPLICKTNEEATVFLAISLNSMKISKKLENHYRIE